MNETTSQARLERVVGVPGAVLMGLGSILGTGIFVSIGIAAGVAGPSVILAVGAAAVVATFNGLSSAQLAASPRWVPAGGLVSCLGLAFWVEPRYWIAGLILIGAGLGWHRVARRTKRKKMTDETCYQKNQ